ncbi:MAG: diguanylate cyclase [Spirochaetales bacterium]|nr:diguanylate cyclase [Spirochaetales bacterium]
MNNIKILIVDDIKENLYSLELLLEDDEMEIITAESGQEALEKTLDHDFFLILLDVQMPGMNGYETAELLRGNSKTKNIPIIFITANNREDQLFKGYDAGAVDYIIKPIAPQILRSKINMFKTFYKEHHELVKKTNELNNFIAELEELQSELEEKNEQLKILSILDGLTGIYNRRYFDGALVSEWNRAVRNGKPLTLIMSDIDYFKDYNDLYGHLAGDRCLQQISKIFKQTFKRKIDKVARYGGEEFIAILPETDSQGAEQIAEKLQETIRGEKIKHEKSGFEEILTVSLGICSVVAESDMSHLTFLESVDRALYSAKKNGRNRWERIEYTEPIHV